jgi:hypothetical protein
VFEKKGGQRMSEGARSHGEYRGGTNLDNLPYDAEPQPKKERQIDNDFTTISIRRKTKKRLVARARYGDSLDAVVNRVLDQNGKRKVEK